jgi:hypothetical protein
MICRSCASTLACRGRKTRVEVPLAAADQGTLRHALGDMAWRGVELIVQG